MPVFHLPILSTYSVERAILFEQCRPRITRYDLSAHSEPAIRAPPFFDIVSVISIKVQPAGRFFSATPPPGRGAINESVLRVGIIMESFSWMFGQCWRKPRVPRLKTLGDLDWSLVENFGKHLIPLLCLILISCEVPKAKLQYCPIPSRNSFLHHCNLL